MNDGQSAISRKEELQPHVGDVNCDWCSKPSTIAFPKYRKVGKGFTPNGLFLYACDEERHRELCKSVQYPPPPKKKEQ